MRKLILATVSVVVFSSLTSIARADSLVAGSTFDVYLFTASTGHDYQVTVGAPTDFTYGSSTGTATEQETIAGDGQDIFTFTILGTSDLFPVASGGYGFVGIGIEMPLQFTAPFDLTAATQSYTDTATGATVGGSTIGAVSTTDPFNGSYVAPSTGVGFSDTTGAGYNEVVVTLKGAAVTPEPASIALLGTGLLGIVGAARRRIRG